MERFSRQGRSYNAALLLATHVVRDLLDERVRNCLSAKFGFRSEDAYFKADTAAKEVPKVNFTK